MKKLLLFVSIVILSVSLNAQDLLKEINDGKGLLMQVANSSDYYLAKKDGTVEIYDSNFDLKKTYSNLPAFEYLSNVSYNYFTMRNEYEFILKRKRNDGTYRYELYVGDTNMYMFNFEGYSPLHYQNKFVAYKQVINEEIDGSTSITYDYRIYSIGGILNKSKEVKQQASNVYPNPAQYIVNIDYSIDTMKEMVIYDTSGKAIEYILLDPFQTTYQIDISKYNTGNYIFKYGDTSGKFIVK